jgi:hypothetical protein
VCKSITAFIRCLFPPPHSRGGAGVVCKSITAFTIYLYPPPHSRGGIKGGVENKILKNPALATDEINICVKVKY